MSNAEIKQLAKNKKVKMWQVADCMGIHPGTLSVMLRHPLDQDDEERILGFIDELAEG